jgi:hypothetical protein
MIDMAKQIDMLSGLASRMGSAMGKIDEMHSVSGRIVHR